MKFNKRLTNEVACNTYSIRFKMSVTLTKKNCFKMNVTLHFQYNFNFFSPNFTLNKYSNFSLAQFSIQL